MNKLIESLKSLGFLNKPVGFLLSIVIYGVLYFICDKIIESSVDKNTMLNYLLHNSLIIIFISLFIITVIVAFSKLRMWNHKRAFRGEHVFIKIHMYSKSARNVIPPRVHSLIKVNRGTEISIINDYFQSHFKCLLMIGSAGIGKSVLSLHCITREDFWFSFLDKRMSSHNLLLLFAQWLKDEEYMRIFFSTIKIGDKHIHGICDKLQGIKRTIVLDNFEIFLDPRDGRITDKKISYFIECLINSDHDCKIIINSRLIPKLHSGKEIASIDEVKILEIYGLTSEFGANLLLEYCDEANLRGELKKLSIRVRGNPLMLNYLGAQLRSPSHTQRRRLIIQWRGQLTTEISEFNFLKGLSRTERKLLYRLCILSYPLQRDHIVFLVGEKKGKSILEGLISKSYIEAIKDKETTTYILNPIISEYIYNQIKNRDILFIFIRFNIINMILKSKHTKYRHEWESFEDCIPMLTFIEQQIGLGEIINAAMGIMVELEPFLYEKKKFMILEILYKNILNVWEAHISKSRKWKKIIFMVLMSRAQVLENLKEYNEAIITVKKAIEMALEMKYEMELAEGYDLLAWIYAIAGEFGKALEIAEEFLQIAAERENNDLQRLAQKIVAKIHHHGKDYEKAIKILENILENYGDQISREERTGLLIGLAKNNSEAKNHNAAAVYLAKTIAILQRHEMKDLEFMRIFRKVLRAVGKNILEGIMLEYAGEEKLQIINQIIEET